MSINRDVDRPCPVCGRRVGGSDGRCGWCDWEDRPDALEELLHEACRHHDLRAALRVATLAGSPDMAHQARLERVLVRHGPVDDGERLRLLHQIQRPRRPSATLDDVAMEALDRLVRGDLCGIMVFVVDVTGIQWFAIEADEIGTPRLLPSDRSRADWLALVPQLADDPDERLFQLAGGHGPRPLDLESADRSLWHTLRDPSSTEDCWRKIVLRPIAGWALLDRAAAVLSERGPRPVEARLPPGERDARELVESLIKHAPIRHPYELALAAVDDDSGEVRVETLPLFPAGATSSARVWTGYVEALPSHLERVSLPVVVTRGRPHADWQAVAVSSLALPPGGVTRVSVKLEAPGLVSVSSQVDTRPDSRTWRELLALLPRRASRGGTPPFDLVFAVELAGERAVVKRRVDLVRTAVDHFSAALRGLLRTGFVGYHDHAFSHGQVERDPLVHVQPLDTPGRAVTALEGWELGSELQHDFGAPVEDALANLERVAWRKDSRRVLVVVGSRPPHPMVQTADRGLPCPYRHDWRWLLHRNDPLTCLMVLGPLPWQGPAPDVELGRRADEAWGALGATGRIALDASDAVDRMLTAVGLSGDDTGPVPLAVAPRDITR